MHVWLTVAESSPILKMSQQAIYTAIREHQIPDAAILRIGRRIRIDPQELGESSKLDGAATQGGTGNKPSEAAR